RLFRISDAIFKLIINIKKYDILILQVYGNFSFYYEDIISFISKASGKKIIFTIHGGSFGEFFDRKKSWVQRVLSRADVITVPSEFMFNNLESRGVKS
ncbi:MAG TPA: hypothetical protein DIS94_02640, partial [Bacteroidetes bacterium]|nr:hypothetical protein [Bacteroidota bacterium]